MWVHVRYVQVCMVCIFTNDTVFCKPPPLLCHSSRKFVNKLSLPCLPPSLLPISHFLFLRVPLVRRVVMVPKDCLECVECKDQM